MGDEKNPIDLTATDTEDEEVLSTNHFSDESDEEMDVDSKQSDDSGDDQDWERLEQGWSRLYRRWMRDGWPRDLPLAGLLGAIEREASFMGQEAPQRPNPRGGEQGFATPEHRLLPEGPPAVGVVRDAQRRRTTFNEEGVREARRSLFGDQREN